MLGVLDSDIVLAQMMADEEARLLTKYNQTDALVNSKDLNVSIAARQALLLGIDTAIGKISSFGKGIKGLKSLFKDIAATISIVTSLVKKVIAIGSQIKQVIDIIRSIGIDEIKKSMLSSITSCC